MSEVFLRDFSEVYGGSFQPNYYMDERLEIIEKLKKQYKNNLLKLKYIVKFLNQKSIAKNVETYIGMANIESNTGLYLESSEDKGQGECNIFNKGEVLFGKLRPYLNKVYYAEFSGGCSSEFIVLDSLNKEKISNKFLSIFLLLDCVVKQTKYLMTGNTLPRMQISDIENLLIPIPPKQIQQQIIDIMDNAYQVKKDKEQQAQELLDSIDEYLLGELGITMPMQTNNTLDSRIFTQSFSNISNTRFDPSYHQKYYQDLEKALHCSPYPLVNLVSTIEDFKKGIEVGSSEYSQNKEIPFVRVSDISSNGIDFDNVQKFISVSLYENLKTFQPQENELLYSKDGTIGICLEADTSRDYIISGGILRLKLTQEVNRYFLQFLLASSMMNILANRQSIGAVIKHLNIDKFLNLKIPLPPLGIQNQIAKKLLDSQYQALALQTKAKEVLNTAKIDIENIILAPDSSGGGGVIYEFVVNFDIMENIFTMSEMIRFQTDLQNLWGGAKYPVVRLANMFDNIQVLTQPKEQEMIYIEIGDVDIKNLTINAKKHLLGELPNNSKVCIQNGDLLVSRVRPNRKAIAIYELKEKAYCTSAFCVLRENGNYKKELLQALLRTNIINDLLVRHTTGSTYPTINNDDILNLKIPLPPLPIQEQIANEITHRRDKAKALQQEAKEILESAKKEVEKMILGG